MRKLLDTLQKDFPRLTFTAGEEFCWSPKHAAIIYPVGATSEAANWALLHEVSHALLDHHNYQSDLELISLESQAWEQAKTLGQKYGHQIDADHIEDCMDTYRDWLHQRSACPVCSTRSLQQDSEHYKCFNCGQVWKVTSSRFCRPYRLKENKKSPQSIASEATFV